MQAPSLLRPRRWDRITARTHCGNVSPNMGRPLFDSAIGGAFLGEEVLTPPATPWYYSACLEEVLCQTTWGPSGWIWCSRTQLGQGRGAPSAPSSSTPVQS